MTYEIITLTPKAKDITGEIFGRLTVIAPVGRYAKNRSIIWRCNCSCGNTKDIMAQSITRGATLSCGCLNSERVSQRATKHGEIKHSLYKTWVSMRSRCNNKNNDAYKNYGARGISICGRWDDFMAFVEDMGDKPDGFTLDRIDNTDNYYPENCKWSSREEQNNNKRTNVILELDGKSLTVAEWSRKLNVKTTTLRKRIDMGWSVRDVLTTKVHGRSSHHRL